MTHVCRYTSLGATHNTHPNPYLRNEDDTYNPAWMLEDGNWERAGRETGKKAPKDSPGVTEAESTVVSDDGQGHLAQGDNRQTEAADSSG